MSDDNEFARYLAQYIVDFYPSALDLNHQKIEELIKQFLDQLP